MIKFPVVQAIKYYKKALKGGIGDYDRLNDCVYDSLSNGQIIEMLNRLLKGKDKGCLLDMILHFLNYEQSFNNGVGPKKKQRKSGYVYEYPKIQVSADMY